MRGIDTRRNDLVIPALRRLALCAVVSLVVSCGAISCSDSPSRPPLPGDPVSFEIGERTLVAEVVFDHTYRQRGLMHRESLGEDRGMLFIFPDRGYRGFWMRNTLIPLSIAYLDDDGTILQIEDMKPKDERRIESKHRVRYALEVNKGWFDRAGAAVGDRVGGFPEKVAKFPAR